MQDGLADANAKATSLVNFLCLEGAWEDLPQTPQAKPQDKPISPLVFWDELSNISPDEGISTYGHVAEFVDLGTSMSYIQDLPDDRGEFGNLEVFVCLDRDKEQAEDGPSVTNAQLNISYPLDERRTLDKVISPALTLEGSVGSSTDGQDMMNGKTERDVNLVYVVFVSSNLMLRAFLSACTWIGLPAVSRMFRQTCAGDCRHLCSTPAQSQPDDVFQNIDKVSVTTQYPMSRGLAPHVQLPELQLAIRAGDGDRSLLLPRFTPNHLCSGG